MRIVVHIDMDAFFASVEERDNRRLAGKPIAVGADPKEGKGRGVVSTANYAARAYGIHSALPISKAWRLSEEARKRGEMPVVFVSPRMRVYEEVSARIRTLVMKRFSAIEQASIDEFYADASVYENFSAVEEACKALQAEIVKKEKLTCSIGIGPNKLIAKIASDRKKPQGLTVVPPDAVLGFLEPLSVRVIPGIGPKTENILQSRKIRSIGELRKLSEDQLVKQFGKHGRDMHARARGEDEAAVEEDREARSVGEQETFEEDVSAPETIVYALQRISMDVFRRLIKDGFKGCHTVVLIVRFDDFTTVNRSHTVKEPFMRESDIRFIALQLVAPFFDKRENPQGKRFRLIGVRLEKLVR